MRYICIHYVQYCMYICMYGCMYIIMYMMNICIIIIGYNNKKKKNNNINRMYINLTTIGEYVTKCKY